MDGQADDVGITAFEAGDVAGGEALDGVGAGFAEGFAGGDVGVDFSGRHSGHLNVGALDAAPEIAVKAEADGGKDEVGAALKGGEHGDGGGCAGRLFEDPFDSGVEQYNGGVGGEHALIGGGVERSGFFAGETGDVGGGGFAVSFDFFDAAGTDLKGDTGLGEQVSAARRFAGKQEFKAWNEAGLGHGNYLELILAGLGTLSVG